MYRILPSMLSANASKLSQQIQILKDGGADALHIDMMDSLYVPRYAFPLEEIKHIRQITDMVLDVHIMTLEPEHTAKTIVSLGVDIVSVHYEACASIVDTLRMIQSMGAKAGMVLNPKTPVSVLGDEILSVADIVQLMSVQPGVKGQTFLSATIGRIQEADRIICGSQANKKTLLQVDGDINFNNLCDVLKAGADSVVVGTALFTGDLEQNIKQFRRALLDAQREENVWHF